MMDLLNEIKNAYGNHFQDLFSELMKLKYGINYKPTSTNGSEGDLKVDGVLNFNIAFAVYAPEIYSDNKTMEKIKSDFEGFIAFREKGMWKNIQKYVFVIKRERSGITSSVLNLVMNFNNLFPVDIMTMDDIYLIAKGVLLFSDDGILLQEFKNDVTEMMEYIVDTDFAAEPFRILLFDEIQSGIISKWTKKRYTFSNSDIEGLKQKILCALNDLCHYIVEPYVRVIHGDRLIFDNTSMEAGERLENELRPQSYRIRCEVRDLLEELYNIK